VIRNVTQTAAPVLRPVTQIALPIARTVRQSAQPVTELVIRLAGPLVQAVQQSVRLAVLPAAPVVTQIAEPVIGAATQTLHLPLAEATQAAEPLVVVAEQVVQAATGLFQPESGIARSPVARPAQWMSGSSPGIDERSTSQGSSSTRPIALAPASPVAPPIDPETAFRTASAGAAGSVTVTTDAVRRAAQSASSGGWDAISEPPAAAAPLRVARAPGLRNAATSEASAAAGLQPGPTEDPAPFPVLSFGSAGSPTGSQLEVSAAVGRDSPPADRRPGGRLSPAPDFLRLPILAFLLERPG
jgi:hypothetical protein